MARFLVKEITEIRVTYFVEADSASSAIKKAKKSEYQSCPDQLIEHHYIANEIGGNKSDED